MKHPMFTAEHDQFRESVRKFVQKELQPNFEKWEEEEFFPNDVFKKLGELGFMGAHYPVEVGGSGGDYLYSVVLLEELARAGNAGIGMGVAVVTGMAVPPINKFGNEDQKKRFVTPAIRGEKIPALGITEPNAGSDVSSITTTAYRDGDHFVMNGSKIFITNGTRCDYVLVVCRTEKGSKGSKGISLIVVEKGTPGFKVSRKLKKIGMLCSDTAELSFEDCRVPAKNLVGVEGQGFKQIMWELQGERLTSCASSVSRAERAFELALKYAKERVQFGKPIAAFQVTQHKLADMAAKIEMCRNFVYNVCAAYGRGEYPVKEISMCKLMVAQLMFQVVDDAMQLHGGYGYMREYEVGHYWRDLRLPRIGGGTDEIMKEIIAGELGLRDKK